MPKIMTPKMREEAHERAKRLKRERHALKVATAKAMKAAEGDANLQAALAQEAEIASKQQRMAHGSLKGGKASPSAITTARENLTRAFELMGGVIAFVAWGKANPTEFYRIWARLIPKEAVEPTGAMPLEELLAQLATKSEKTVATAAYEIGEEVLIAARKQVSLEDVQAAFVREEDDTLQ